MEPENHNNAMLKKSVSFVEALALVVGMIIGSGIFLKPSVVLASAGSPLMAVLAWAAGGVVTLASALSVAEIASAIPKTGGLYAYLEELYGETWGFLLGWVQTVISYPASIAAQAIAFATYANVFLPMSGWQQKALGVGIMAFVLLMNILSTKYGGIIQTLATVGKLIPVASIVLFGLLPQGELHFASAQAAGAAGFGAAILGTLWAYDGWIGVANMAGELKNPGRDLPRVISMGVLFVTLVYVLFNLAIFKVLPAETVAASDTPGALAAAQLFGSGGAAFITAGIMISVFGALNGYLMTAARVPLAMSQKAKLPGSRILGKLHPKFGTPANALILQCVLAALYILSGSFNALTDLLIFVLWIFFAMGVVGVFILRKKHPEKKGPYKAPLYPVTPIIGALGAGYILVSTVFSSPFNSLAGVAITALGLPVFAWMKKQAGKNGSNT